MKNTTGLKQHYINRAKSVEQFKDRTTGGNKEFYASVMRKADASRMVLSAKELVRFAKVAMAYKQQNLNDPLHHNKFATIIEINDYEWYDEKTWGMAKKTMATIRFYNPTIGKMYSEYFCITDLTTDDYVSLEIVRTREDYDNA